MQLKNYTEDIVIQTIYDVLKDTDYCTCEKCINDIAALALNQLPTRYVVSEKGELYVKAEQLNTQYPIDIIAVITRAAEIVNKNPRHNK